ncbi:hypothetical protein D3C80_1197080 [compost metagenome]
MVTISPIFRSPALTSALIGIGHLIATPFNVAAPVLSAVILTRISVPAVRTRAGVKFAVSALAAPPAMA